MKRTGSPRWLIGLVAAAFFLPFLTLRAQPTVTEIEIRHIGPPAVSDELIRANIRVKPGDALLPGRIDDDVRNLYATGYFYNIRVVHEPGPAGIKLAYVVQGNPLVTDIRFVGNKKFGRSRLLKRITTKVGEPLNERKLFTDSQEIQRLYQKSGMQKTTARAVSSIEETTGRATVTFEIEEGPKVRIQRIEFEGNDLFSNRRLRKVIKTKQRGLLTWVTGSAVFKDEQFEDDQERLIEFYQNEGYIDFAIRDVEFDYLSPTKMVIRFIISEGKRYRVGDVTLRGNRLFPSEEIQQGVSVLGVRRQMRMTVGEIFTPGGLRRDIEALQDFYGAKGYVDARVVSRRNANVIAGTMDIVYEIDEGDKSFIERIDIKGNVKTKDKVIRRELAVSPGEVFDMVRVKLSQQRIEGLDYFQKVETRAEDTDVPDRKNLVIGVEEKNTGSLTVGAGLSSVDNVVGFVEVSQGNFDLFKPPTFTGGGQKFRLRMQIGTRRQDYQISFIEPWFLDRKLALGVDLYHRELGFLSRVFDETHTGGSVSLTRALGSDFLIGRVAYTLERIDVDIDRREASRLSAAFRDEEGARLVSKVGGSLAYDTRNSTMLASRGQRTEFLTELAGGPFGADTDFYKLELRSAWYFPGFFEGHILEVAGRTGVVDSYGRGDRGRDRVPIFDRWFLGGAYSLRGYRYRDIGPRDPLDDDEPIGGETYWFGTVEYSLPIIERLRFATFYDIGNVYPNAFSFSTDSALHQEKFYSDNWGIGLRINLPIGPLRLDYGFPITHDDALSGKGRFQFTVGWNREF